MTDAIAEYAARQALGAKRSRKRKQRESIPPDVLEAKIIDKPCRVCAVTYGHEQVGVSEAHHLIPRSRLRGRELNHADNLIPLCHEHHQHHHTTTDRVPRALLEPAEVVFITHLETSGWCDLWYPIEVEELDE